jgi:two-component system chemotaxis response regulator CheY
MSRKILVVDDSNTTRGQLRFTLADAGYEVIEAVDGLDGLAKLRAHRDIAMVLCDVNMPRQGGLEMLESLPAHLPGRVPPIVVLTTEGAVDLIQRAQRAGAKGWIRKPFKPELLLAAVQKLTGSAGPA